MSLERKAAKKQFIDLSGSSSQTSAKRENNFNNKGVSAQYDQSKAAMKMKGEELTSDRFRKATLSPP